jgi:hypothetical protein
MNNDRRAILSLVAIGRITPREAERLLAVCPSGEDVLIPLMLLLGLAWMALPYLTNCLAGFAHTLAGLFPLVRHTLACATHWFGGLS